MTDFFISSSEMFTEKVSRVLEIDSRKFLPVGMPRNDIFFEHAKHQQIREKVCNLYGISAEDCIVLYAPTFRGGDKNPSQFNYLTDISPIAEAVHRRFGRNPVFLCRCHLGVSFSIGCTIDANGYPDMQELLIAADILITDYSSSIWDYSFTYRPGFLYTPDLAAYEKNPGIHIPIDSWQYPYALTVEELCTQIIGYDEERAVQKIVAHHRLLNSFEKGTATREVVSLIENFINRQCV